MAYVAQSTPEDASPPSTRPSEAASQADGAKSDSKNAAEAGKSDSESADESKDASSTDESDTDEKDSESSEESTDDESKPKSDEEKDDDEEDDDSDEDKDKDKDEDDGDDEATSTTDIDPRLPPGGINMITPAPLSGSQYYKIGDYVTFGWNYTSLSVTPKSIDVMASCSLNNQLYTIAVNQSVEKSQMVVWDTEAEATNSAPPPMYVFAFIASARDRPPLE